MEIPKYSILTFYEDKTYITVCREYPACSTFADTASESVKLFEQLLEDIVEWSLEEPDVIVPDAIIDGSEYWKYPTCEKYWNM